MACITAGAAVGGWLLRQMWDAVEKLRTDLQHMQAKLADNYARKDDVRDMFRDLLDAIRRVEDALTHKADK